MKIRVTLIALTIAALGGSADGGIGFPPPPGDFKPTWSPDASAIVFASSRSPAALRVVLPDGTGDRPIPVPMTAAFAFSPNWYWIAFPTGYGSPLVIMRPDGSQRHEVPGAAYGVAPSWAPDGRRLAFQRQDGIYVVNADGSGLRRLTDVGAYPAWSPSGDRIAYSAAPFNQGGLRIAWVDRLADTQLLGPGLVGTGPVEWSPDATQIAFATRWTNQAPSQLGVVTVRDGAVRRYPVAGGVSSFDWSPTRPVIAVAGSGLQLVELTTSSVRQILPYGDYPAWSPDGDQLAVSTGGECRNRTGIYRLNFYGGPPAERLTNDCRIVGTSGPDSLVGTPLPDLIVGLGGDDRLVGSSSDLVGDTLEGDEGNDILVGTRSPDTLEGGPGADVLEGGPSHDLLRGGPGRDVLRGEGGNDLIEARDGERDMVSCGTNVSAGTAPQGEADTAYVDAIDAVSKDCEYVWRVGTFTPPKGRINLTITLIPNSGRPKVGRRSFTLGCRPARGTLPHRVTACSKLLQVQNPFAPVPPDQACTQIYGGAQEAVVTGVYGGKALRTTFNRTNGCQIARWNRVGFLFPIPTGIQ